jgi:GxxExxY protein
MSQLILEPETYRILVAGFEVYKEKGCGFVEPVYQEGLELELASQGIEFLAQQEMGLSDKGRPFRQTRLVI